MTAMPPSLTHSTPPTLHAKDVSAGYDDRTIYMVDEDSHLYGRLLDDGRMEICILETGAGAMIAVCSLNERQE